MTYLYLIHFTCCSLFAVLDINFDQPVYSIEEGSSMPSSTIRLSFRTNQNPFTLTLCSATVDRAESDGVGVFINSIAIAERYRATEGRVTKFINCYNAEFPEWR